jgi:hypothetical protein
MLHTLTSPFCQRLTRATARTPSRFACLSLLTSLATTFLATAAHAGDYILYAMSIPNVADWTNESYAAGDPGCSSGCPCDDGDYSTNASGTGYMTATDLQSFTLPAGQMIVSVRVNALVRFDNNESGAVRLKATLPSYGMEFIRDSGTFTSDTGCDYEYSVDEGEIKDPNVTWTQAMVNNIELGIRRLSANPPSNNTLRCKALRVRVITAPIPIVCPGAGSCCVAHANPGCDNAACCNAVCAIDSFCCQTQWDALCAESAAQVCGICGPICPNGICEPGESWPDCVDCPPPPSCPAAGECCVPHGNGGCADATCCDAVCAIDSFCCDVSWDLTCAEIAADTCPGCAVPPPPNDECSNAQVITSALTSFDTDGATDSTPPLPVGCTDSFSGDVWFRYVATCTGTALFSTCGAGDPDTVLAVYGGTCGALTSLGCNDDDASCPGIFPSKVSVPVVAGSMYYVRLGGYDGPVSGALSVTCAAAPSAPANDNCSGALTVGNGSTAFSTATATTSSPALPSDCAFGFAKDVWFKYVGTCSAATSFSTCGNAGFDTVIVIYSGSCSSLQLIGCNDDAGDCSPELASEITVDTTVGQTYYVRIGGYSGSSGSGALTIECAALPANPDLDGNGTVGQGDLAILLGAWGTPGPGDLDGSGQVGASDLALLIGAWG